MGNRSCTALRFLPNISDRRQAGRVFEPPSAIVKAVWGFALTFAARRTDVNWEAKTMTNSDLLHVVEKKRTTPAQVELISVT